MRFLFCIAFLSVYAHAFAGIQDMWKSIPDSILDNERATVTPVSDKYMYAQLSGSCDVQLRLMAAEGGEPVVCMVRTYSAPEKESVVEIFDAGWVKLRTITFTLSDVIGEENAERLSEYFEPLLIRAELQSDADTLLLSVSDKYLSEDERKKLDDVKLQRNVNWGTGKFK